MSDQWRRMMPQIEKLVPVDGRLKLPDDKLEKLSGLLFPF